MFIDITTPVAMATVTHVMFGRSSTNITASTDQQVLAFTDVTYKLNRHKYKIGREKAKSVLAVCKDVFSLKFNPIIGLTS